MNHTPFSLIEWAGAILVATVMLIAAIAFAMLFTVTLYKYFKDQWKRRYK